MNRSVNQQTFTSLRPSYKKIGIFSGSHSENITFFHWRTFKLNEKEKKMQILTESKGRVTGRVDGEKFYLP